MRGEEPSGKRSFAARCVFCRSLPFSLSLSPFPILSLYLFLSFPLFRSETLLPAPGLASDVFHQINSRSMREYALLFTPRRRVCIISFIIQLALNSTLFRSHDRSLRLSSSFFPRTHSTRGRHPAPPLARALELGSATRPPLLLVSYSSSCQCFRFSFTKPNHIYFLFLREDN